MIINFSIKNFRSIKDKVTLSFEPAEREDLDEYYVVEPKKGIKILKAGLLFGPNASGKTNILNALNFFIQLVISPLDLKNKEFDFSPFMLTNTDTTEFELEFFHQDTKYFYQVVLTQKAIISEKLYFFSPKKAVVYSRETDENKKLARVKFGSKIKVSKDEEKFIQGNTLWNNTVLGAYLKTNLDIPEITKAVAWFENKFEFMFQPNIFLEVYTKSLFKNKKINKYEILEMMKYADLGIKRIDIEYGKLQVNKENKEILKMLNSSLKNLNHSEIYSGDQEVEIQKINFLHQTTAGEFSLLLQDESDGTQRYFFFANLLLDTLKNNKILVIDEVEASLHPDLLKHFFLTFLVNSQEAQFIATTHNRELLQEKEILRRDVIWFTERNSEQATEFFSLSDFDTKILRKVSSYYNLYKIGKLGAVPNLGSYYLKINYGKKEK